MNAAHTHACAFVAHGNLRSPFFNQVKASVALWRGEKNTHCSPNLTHCPLAAQLRLLMPALEILAHVKRFKCKLADDINLPPARRMDTVFCSQYISKMPDNTCDDRLKV